VARIEGGWNNYRGFNIWGGKNPESRADFGGKSYGIISIDGVLYMWVGPGSGPKNFNEARLYRSTNHGASWRGASWKFTKSEGLMMPTILQFGRDYAGAKDNFVYHYFIEPQDDNDLVIQKPGRIYLLRVHKDDIFSSKSNYQYFNGLDSAGNPNWSNNIGNKKPVFEDPNGVGWNVAVSYNAGLGRYLLTMEHAKSHASNLGIFDAPEPWGPWTTVGYYSNWQGFDNLFYWNFSNKWLSSDGRDFTLIFTGVKANDSWNTIRGSFTVAPTAPPPPPPPTPPDPLPIPGRIEAEDYKSGGEGVAYHDTTSGNSGGAYRSDDVDIQPTSDQGGGYNIGCTRQGEWLAFDVAIAQAGYYDITARVASAVAGTKSLHLKVDGVDVTGPLSFSDASGWQSWLDVTVPQVNLPAGRHELRLVLDTDYFNVNYLDITPSPAPALPIPGRIEAEDYKAGGEGVGYHDTTSGNTGGEFRADDVDLEVATEGGYNVGWIDPGEWLAFDVEIAQAGYYDITARVASAVAGEKTLHLKVDGVDVTGPLSFSDASGWQSWLDVTVPRVNLPAGRHELRLVLDADSFNVNYLEVRPSDNLPPTVSGDANQDGQLTGDDVYLVIDWIIGRQPMPQTDTPAFTAADVDADGSITANDVALMIDWLSGDPDQSPLEPSL
jgi:hypothetical protein